MDMSSSSQVRNDVPYILAHSEREIARLKHQADIINPITKRILLSAGIGSGMRVLDVGCGGGDVSCLVSEMVGNNGRVVGVDRAPEAVETARRRASAHGLRNVSFLQGDPAMLAFDHSFDAVVGRYVLMFQSNPTIMLRALVRHLQPGGLIVFHEPDWAGCTSSPPASTYDQCCHWIVETFRRCGIETRMGIKLESAFRGAGLAAPAMHLEAVVGGTRGGSDWLHQTVELVATMLPDMEKQGVVTAAEVDIDTLEERMQHEIATDSVIVSRFEVGAWSHLARMH